MENQESNHPNQFDTLKRPTLSVKALLVAHNIKQKDIAEKYFIHPSELCRVIQGKRKTPYIRTILAHLLNMPVEELWADRG